MDVPFLVGERIYLRALQEEDINSGYISWLNDAEVCKYNSHHIFPYNEESAIDYIQQSRKNNNSLILAVVSKDDHKHVGNISLQNINYINRNAEFAIILGERSIWGKGYSKEASLLLLKHGFYSMNLHKVYCGTSSENVPMQKLANYLGMTEEGRRIDMLYKNGKFVDIVEYGVLKKDFMSKFQREIEKGLCNE